LTTLGLLLGQQPRIRHEELIIQGASARLVLRKAIEVGDRRTRAAGWATTSRWEASSGWIYKSESIDGWVEGWRG